MTYVIAEPCVNTKDTACVEVCPVACFYEMEGQLVIHPEECIDCTACVDTCPVEAIYADHALPPEHEASLEFNATEARRMKAAGQEAIVKRKEPLPTAAERKKALGY